MRREATIEEWKQVYELATQIKEMKPWDSFWDMDVIGIQDAKEQEPTFISILGRNGDCYGISIYEGYEGLNDFLLITMNDSMNVSVDYAMFSQKCMTCYWGNRDELSTKQLEIVKELGYKYRGKNQWLYFLSYQPDYFPYNLDQDEVRRMIRYLTHLINALEYYKANDIKIDFDKGKMFLYSKDKNTEKWSGKEAKLPLTMYRYQKLEITDELLLEKLRRSKKNAQILEADIVYLGGQVNDNKYERPLNPKLCVVVDSISQMILKADIIDPQKDANIYLAESIIGFINTVGSPKEIRVTNCLMQATLAQLCETAGIHLKIVNELPGVKNLLHEMRGY